MDILVGTLGVLAGLVQLAGYWQYHKAMQLKGNKPSPASWFMWAVDGGVDLFIFAMLTKDWEKNFLSSVCAIAAIAVFVQIWRRERTLRLSKSDYAFVVMNGLLVAFYVATRNPFISNALLGVSLAIAFTPNLFAVWSDPNSESPQPWFIWTLAYVLLTLVIVLEWQNWWELIYPVTSIVLTGAVGLIASFKHHTNAVSTN